MTNIIVLAVVVVPVLLAFIVGGILLQIFLSKCENKWLGLILPILSALLSLFWPLNMAVVTGLTGILMVLLVWLIANIPTAILLVIYFACREKLRHKQNLNKMNIQDL